MWIPRILAVAVLGYPLLIAPVRSILAVALARWPLRAGTGRALQSLVTPRRAALAEYAARAPLAPGRLVSAGGALRRGLVLWWRPPISVAAFRGATLGPGLVVAGSYWAGFAGIAGPPRSSPRARDRGEPGASALGSRGRAGGPRRGRRTIALAAEKSLDGVVPTRYWLVDSGVSMRDGASCSCPGSSLIDRAAGDDLRRRSPSRSGSPPSGSSASDRRSATMSRAADSRRGRRRRRNGRVRWCKAVGFRDKAAARR